MKNTAKHFVINARIVMEPNDAVYTQEDAIKAERKYFSERMFESFGEMLIQKYGLEVTTRILQPECIEDTMRLLLWNFQHNLMRQTSYRGMTHIKDVITNSEYRR